MRKVTSGAIAVLLATAGLAFTAAPASAHTPAASATCEAISISASNYQTKPGSGEPTIANPNYKPATPGTPAVGEPRITVPNPDYKPAVEATYKTEYLYKQLVTGKEKWLDSKTWNPGIGWYYADQTRQVEATPSQPAVGEPTIVIDNPAYVPATEGTPAVGEPTIANPNYVAADETPNTVTVSVDGQQVYSAEFGQSHTATIPLDGTKKHTWIASFIGWNGVGTQKLEGTTTACAVPIQEIPYPKLLANEVCGADNDTVYVDPAWVEKYGTLVNGPWIDTNYKTQNGERVVDGSAQIKPEFRKTHIWAGTGETTPSDFRRWQMYPGTEPFRHVDVDSKYQSTDSSAPCYVNVPESVIVTGEWSTPDITCDSEVGDVLDIERTVTTTTSTLDPTTGKVTESTVESTEEGTYTVTQEDIDALTCEVPPTEEPEEPTTPTTPEEPTSDEPTTTTTVARAAAADSGLAQTGADPATTLWGLTFGALALASGAGLVVLGLRRRQVSNQQ